MNHREAVQEYSARDPLLAWYQWAGALLFLVIALPFTFRDGLINMVQHWSQEEYSHGYLIPFVAIWIVWQKRRDILECSFDGAWLGVLVVFVGLIVSLVGDLGAVYALVQYAFLLTLSGMVFAVIGWRGVRLFWVPLVYLFFMIPVPDFLYNRLSVELQLISSEWGVGIIRFFGISVFLDGNIIDLGSWKMLVVEACSGLRYLFPLMSFGFLFAYLYKGPFWSRALLFLSTIPITILMNSFRIGVIGVLLEYYGRQMAEGFLHDFEGWVIFVACVAMLIAEMWILNRLRREKRPLTELFNLKLPKPAPRSAGVHHQTPPLTFIISIACLLLAAVGSMFMAQRAEALPDRQMFVSFPLELDEWRGQRVAMEQSIIYALRVDDWIMANFWRPRDPVHVNFYVAYYASQRKGASAHSPRSCIPGGGWRIEDLTQTPVSGVRGDGVDLMVNRVVIKKGQITHLVYYWFQQRERLLTNEFVVKWYILWDAITRNRTDGALIRVLTPFGEGEGEAEADQRLTDFIRETYPRLNPYLPAPQAGSS